MFHMQTKISFTIINIIVPLEEDPESLLELLELLDLLLLSPPLSPRIGDEDETILSFAGRQRNFLSSYRLVTDNKTINLLSSKNLYLFCFLLAPQAQLEAGSVKKKKKRHAFNNFHRHQIQR